MHFAVGPFGDVDNTKFKSYILEHRQDPQVAPFFDLGFAKRPEHELYDLSSDPDQVRNIAADPTNQKRVQSLQDRVKRWMKETGDPRFKNPGDDVFTNYQYFGGPPKKRKN